MLNALREIEARACNYVLANGGSVSVSPQRLAKGNSNKQERAKFEKELRMAAVFASQGHRMEFLDEIPGRPMPDVLIDGRKADFKATRGSGNIVKYAKHAVRKQGVEMVLFEFEKESPAIYKQLLIVKRMGVACRFYFKDHPQKIHSL